LSKPLTLALALAIFVNNCISMRVSAQGFRAPKLGNRESECEDAFYPRRKIISQEATKFPFAVADGATESLFSGLWAKQLVKAFGKGLLDGPTLPEGIGYLREKWRKIVSRRPLPWYAEEKIRSGAFAAVACLVLEDADVSKDQGTWKAMAVGDSCVFHLRKRKVLKWWPIQKSEDFNNSPRLLSSKIPDNEGDKVKVLQASGAWRGGDTFYLMTDAVACWFLKQVETGSVPARELTDLTDGESNSFHLWLQGLRERKSIRNDDVTILRIEIEKD
jgi:Protein phosphatase 2C